MSNDRIKKIANNISETERVDSIKQAKEKREDIANTVGDFGSEIINQEKLNKIAENIWIGLLPAFRERFTADDWRDAIYRKCQPVIQKAEEELEKNKIDDRTHAYKIKILRTMFAKQAFQAMKDVSELYQKKSNR